ncbi:MAG: glycosyltransferase [Nanoarchaeota archaeon]
MKRLTIIIPAPLDKNLPIEVTKTIDKKKVEIIIERGNNPSINRNRGIKKAKTELVAFTNIHSKLAKNWYEEVIKFFDKNKEVSAVGGPQFTENDGKAFQRASGHALKSPFGSAVVSKRYKENKENLDSDETEITSANLICRKSVFEKVIFNEKLYPGEDPKFVEDIKNVGFKVAYSPRIVAYNQRRPGIMALAKQIYNYGVVRPKKESVKKTLAKPYFFVPTIFIIYLLSIIPLTTISKYFLIPLWAYIILNIIVMTKTYIKTNDLEAAIMLPVVFLTIHVSYGFGIFQGLVNKIFSPGERVYK